MSSHVDVDASLLDLFLPPKRDDGECRRGVFGLLCALSGDSAFIERVMHSFTGLSAPQRERSGRLSMALFLDASHPRLEGIPGLAWGYPTAGPRAAKMLHAKVALLGFGGATHGEVEYVRLIVFTGNWTTEAVNGQINLAWYCDYDLSGQTLASQEASDMHAALAFWRALLGSMDGRDGYFRMPGPGRESIDGFLTFVSGAIPPSRLLPRFMSTISGRRTEKVGIFRAGSIGAQVLLRFGRSRHTRNFLCCGSGFFEKPGPSPAEPSVLKQLTSVLRNGKFGLTRNLRRENKHLIVNPDTSGAAGVWLRDGDGRRHWSYYRPHNALSPKSVLHAKYILLANVSEIHERMTHGILYLGSANLSVQGFTLLPGQRGNIEVGIVQELRGSPEMDDLYARLGIRRTSLSGQSVPKGPKDETAELGGMECPPLPPIDHLFYDRVRGLLTIVPSAAADSWSVMSIGGVPVASSSTSFSFPNGSPGIALKVIAKRKTILQSWLVPVFQEPVPGSAALFATPPPLPQRMDSILSLIADFPEELPEVDDTDPDTRDPEAGGGAVAAGTTRGARDDLQEERVRMADYPLHMATSLVEAIADKNQTITASAFPDWVARLRQLLLTDMDPGTTDKMRSVGTDFMKPLRDVRGFSPNTPSVEYEKLVDEIRVSWNAQTREPGAT